ncbi:MAG: tetratricopeptide repeat protein [Myxococcales bacterium]|nr:MAG: tetratricopeptide repeat protein [Myxococcales bacterium]
MSAQTIRTALGQLQDDPDLESAWNELQDAVTAPEPGLTPDELSKLLESARQVHESRREWEAVARLLELETALAGGKPNEIAFLAEQARVFNDEQFDSMRALPVYRRMAALRPDDETVTEAIERIEANRGRWRDVVARFVEDAAESDEPAFRSALLRSASEYGWRYGRLEAGVADEAVTRLEEALEIDRTNTDAAKLLEVIYRREGRWAELAKVLEVIATEDQRDEQLGAHLRLAHLASKRLEDPARAVQAYRQALALVPGQPEALRFLAEHYSEQQKWDDLVALYEEQLTASKGRADELDTLLQIGMVHWRMREQPEAAEPWFERARKLSPAHPVVVGFFREILDGKQKARLITVLTEAQRAMADGPERAAISTELARLAEDDANAGKAIEQYKASLRADPTNTAARDALKRLYTQTEAWVPLIDILKQELERTPADDRETRLGLLRDIARLHRQHVKNDTALVPILTQTLQLDEQNEEAARELVRVYEALSRWRDLLAYQQKLADIVSDRDEKATLYRAVARRWIDQFSNVGNGIEAYEALLQVEPQDEEARSKLRELYTKRRSWAALYALSEREAGFAEGRARVELLLEMAKLAAERLDRGADAVRLYKEALALDPEAPGLLDALEKQAERDKDFVTVAEVLERRVEQATDDNARLNVLQKLGGVYADRLNDPTGAARAWRRVLALKPDHPKALRVLRDAYLAAGDLDNLEELYAAQNDWDGLAEVLSGAADKATDDELKVKLSLHAARVYEDRLGQPERAFRSYERVLSVRPADERSARALVPIYEKEERWARLPALYEILLQHATTTDEKVALYRRLAEVTGQKLAEKAAAVGHARRAYELAPEAPDALDFLEQAARAASAWTELTGAIQGRLTGGGESLSAADRRSLQARLADVYASHLDKVDEAVAIYRALVEEDPTDQDTIATLDRILRSAGRQDDLRWLFELRAQNTVSSARAHLFDEWAQLEEEVFGEPQRATALYRRVLELTPDNGSALGALGRLLLASGDAAGASEVVVRRRDLATGSERAERELDLADLYAGPLAQPAEALAAAVRALQLAPGERRGIQRLEQLLEVPATRAEAARVLQGEYERGGEPAREAAVLRVMLEASTDPVERLDLFQRLTAVHEGKLGDAATALAVLLEAVHEFPLELSLWDQAAAQATAANQFGGLADALRTELERPDTAAVEVALCERAAALHDEKLADPPGAVPYLDRILAREPGNEGAFVRLKQILTTAERWADLEALYARVTAAASPSRQVELLAEMALVCEEITGDRTKAITYYERILELDPFHEQALRALDALYQQEGRSRELASLLERRLERASDGERVSLMLRLGQLRLDALGDSPRALGHLDEVLLLEPANEAGRAMVERILDDAALRPHAAAILERVYTAIDDPTNLVRALEVRLESAEGDDLRRELLGRVAELRDRRLGDDAGTFAALTRLVPLAPGDATARERLLLAADALGTHERAANVLLMAADQATALDLKAAIMMEVALVYQGPLQDPARAEEIYRRVVSLDPENPALVLPAAQALERIYEATSNPRALADTLRLEVRLESSSETRRDLWARLGDLCESVLDDPAGAIDAWKARLDEEPGDERALTALERLYERTGAWAALVATLRSREQVTTEGGERRRLMVKAAETLSERLDDTAGAIDAWRAVVDEFGPDRATLGSLAALHQKAGQWQDLAATLENELGLVDDTTSKLALLGRLGDVRRQHLDDLPGALDAYRQALQLDPSHPPSRLALELLLEVPAARREAAGILHPLYESDGDFEHLLRVLDIEVETADNTTDRLEGLDKAVRTAEGPLTDPARAFEYARRAVREAVAEPSLVSWFERIETLAASTGKYAELVEVLASVSDDILDEEVQRQTRLRLAELARVQLGNRELARDWYKKALELRSDDRAALTALESLYEEMNDAPALLDILRRRVEVAESDDERRSLLYRQAKLTREVSSDPGEAIRVYESVLELGLDAPAVLALEALYTEQGRATDLVALYERQLGEGAPDRAELHVKLAAVAEQHLRDIPRAFEELESALQIDAQYPGAIAALERLLVQAEEPSDRARAGEMLELVYKARADWKSLLRALDAQLAASQDPTQRRELLRQLALLHEEQQEDYVAALETTAKLLHEELTDESTWAELERLAKVASAEARLAQIYATELAEIDSDDPTTTRLARRTGELFTQLGDIDQALKFYRRALAFEPESRELFQAIDALLINAGRASERVELYRSALDHRFEPADRLATLHIIADLEENALGQPDQAIDTYRAAVDVDDRDHRSLEALTRLYRSRQRWRDLADLYLRRAEQEADAEASATHRLALARLYRSELGEVSSAIDQLEQIVGSLPWHREAIAELESLTEDAEHKARVVEILNPLYARADDWQNLIRLAEQRLGLAQDPGEKIAIYREAAQLYEERASDRARAFEMNGKAFLIDPQDGVVRADLERLAESLGAWDELTAIYEQAIAEGDSVIQRELLLALARVHDQRRDDPRRALVAYKRLHRLDEGDVEPLEAMAPLSMMLSDWSEHVDVLAKKAELISGDDERASLYQQVGGAKRDMMDDQGGAIVAYEKAFELDPASVTTADALIDLHEGRQDATRLVELYRRRIDLTDNNDDLRYELLSRMARSYEGVLNQRREAIEALREALAVRANDKAVLQWLDQLFRHEQMWPDLLENLRLQAAIAETTGERVELRRAMGDLHRLRLDDPLEALECYRQVLDEAPGDDETIRAVREIGDAHDDMRAQAADILDPVLRSGGRWADLIGVLEMRLKALQDPPGRAQTLRTIAIVQEMNLGNTTAAEEALLRALSDTPDDEEIHAELERLAAIGGWERYATALGERAEAQTDPVIAQNLQTRLGQIAEEHLKDDARAIAAYRIALDHAGDDPALLAALDRLLGRTGDSRALAEILERRVGVENDMAARADLLHRLALLQINDFQDPRTGLGTLRAALESRQEHPGAREALEALTSNEELFDEAAETLDQVYRTLGDNERLAGLLDKRVAHSTIASDRIRLRLELSRVVEEKLADAGRAQTVLEAALADDPSDLDVIVELERLMPITGRWASGAAALDRAIASATSLPPDQARDLSVRLAEWHRDRLGDRTAAEAAFERALSHDPESLDILRALEELRRAPGRERELVDTLRRRARVETEIEQKKSLLKEAKELAQRLGDDALAEATLRQLLEENDADVWALENLTELREKAGDWKEAASLLLKHADLAEGDRIAELRHRAATILRDRLADKPGAIKIFEDLFENDLNDARASAALRVLYQETDQTSQQSRLLERLIDVATSPADRTELRIEQARLQAHKLDNVRDAIDTLRAVLEEEPGHSEAVVELSQLYEKSGKDDDLAELLTSQIELAESRGDQRAELTFKVRLGEIYENRLKDSARAIETYQGVLAKDPLHKGALAAVARLQTARDNVPEAITALSSLLMLEEGPAAVAVALQLADAHGKQKNDEGARDALERALAIEPQRAEVRAQLRTLYERTGAWPKLADLIAGDADEATAVPDKVRLYRQAADIHRERLAGKGEGDAGLPAAAALLEKASALLPDDRELLLTLCDAYTQAGRGQDAIRTLERIKDSYGGKRSKELATVHQRLAQAFLSEGDKARALTELDAAFKIDPGSVATLRDLGQLTLDMGDLDRAQKTFRALLLQKLDGPAPITKAEVFFYLGDISQRQGDKAKAIQMLERSIENDPGLQKARDLLAQLKG